MLAVLDLMRVTMNLLVELEEKAGTHQVEPQEQLMVVPAVLEEMLMLVLLVLEAAAVEAKMQVVVVLVGPVDYLVVEEEVVVLELNQAQTHLVALVGVEKSGFGAGRR